jgi:hypothetical protein
MCSALAQGDQRDVAHHLALWGADPAAAYELMDQPVAPSLIEAAFRNNRAGAFEEMVLWHSEGLSTPAADKLRVPGDVNGVMAGYAEARGDRFLRGNVEVTKAAGGGAIAVALRHEKYEFARLLIAEGFALKDSPEHLRAELRLHGTAKAKQFAEEHLSGKMKVISVPDVGRKRRSEIQILTFPGFRGHYGMF